ncbi:hypothetical protein [Formosa sp. 4Alg 33]|uniref:hypothetical protein n=1 Tax=Formosa sp. 4Alg 33 TaxID=3382189 RepID=UPI003D9C5977
MKHSSFKIQPYLYLLIAILITSCSTLDELTKFDVSYNRSVTIPSITPINFPITINTPDFDTNTESTFSINNTTQSLVDDIKLKEFRLTLTNPSTEDFSFLEILEIYIASEGLEDKKLAWSPSPIENDSNVLYLETTDDDLKEYIFKDSFYLKIKTTTDEVLTEDHEMEINTVFTVDAKILGI